jgi:hypothetical protein
MNQSTFETFVRNTATLLDRRSLFAGLSAGFLATTGVPLNAGAKKRKKRNRGSKASRKRVQFCLQRALPECEIVNVPNCEAIVNDCCKKASQSLDKAQACLDANDPRQ